MAQRFMNSKFLLVIGVFPLLFMHICLDNLSSVFYFIFLVAKLLIVVSIGALGAVLRNCV